MKTPKPGASRSDSRPASEPNKSYQVMYKGPDGTWVDIDPTSVRRRLAGNYRNVHDIMKSIDQGVIVQTNFAFYRRKSE